MTQMEFIPLKTPSGELAGHARVKDGVVRFALRSPTKGRAVVLTKAGGIVTDLASGAAVTSQVLAVALEESGRLLASGLARGVTLTKDELRRRVQIYAGDSVKRIERREQQLKRTAAMEEPPLFQEQSAIAPPQGSRGADEAEARHSEPTAAAVQRAERYEPRETLEETRRQELANMAAVEPPNREREEPLKRSALNRRERELRDMAGVAGPDAKRASFRPAASIFQDRVSKRAGGDDESWPPPAPMAPKEELPRRAPEKAHPLFAAEAGAAEALSNPPEPPLTDPDTEAFFALLRRSDAVYRSIYEPVTPKEPQDPLPFSRSAANPVPSWHGEVDALLNQVTEQQRINIPNPFPHIFPNAAFVKIVKNGVAERLEGDWRRGAERFRVHAVPGSYSPMPPQELAGYTRYIRSRAGGFWVKVVDMNPTPPS